MANTIGRAGSALNLRLGQSPTFLDPQVTPELQEVYNALHLLGEYMDVLRKNLESAPGQTPDQSIRFRRTFWATAAQEIKVGAICCAVPAGIVNGVLTEVTKNNIDDPFILSGSTSSRQQWGVAAQQFFIALTAALPGELVQVGEGPGVTRISGLRCGQLLWAADSRSISSFRAANLTAFQVLIGRDLVGNGGVYLNNPTSSFPNFPTRRQCEGYHMPGSPQPYGAGGSYVNRVFLYPIAVGIADGYALLYDYKADDFKLNIPF